MTNFVKAGIVAVAALALTAGLANAKEVRLSHQWST